MLPEEYIKNVLKTESNDFPNIITRFSDQRTIRLLHAAMGLVTESAEFLDALKAHLFYGKPIDEVNLKEELGDKDWYGGLAIDALETSFEQIWERNIAKLHKRYGISFNEDGAMNRDLSAERYVLEKDNKTNTKSGAVHYLQTNEEGRDEAYCDEHLVWAFGSGNKDEVTCSNCLQDLFEDELANIAGEK